MFIRTTASMIFLGFAGVLLAASILLRRNKKVKRWVLVYCAGLFAVAAIFTWLGWINFS